MAIATMISSDPTANRGQIPRRRGGPSSSAAAATAAGAGSSGGSSAASPSASTGAGVFGGGDVIAPVPCLVLFSAALARSPARAASRAASRSPSESVSRLDRVLGEPLLGVGAALLLVGFLGLVLWLVVRGSSACASSSAASSACGASS